MVYQALNMYPREPGWRIRIKRIKRRVHRVQQLHRAIMNLARHLDIPLRCAIDLARLVDRRPAMPRALRRLQRQRLISVDARNPPLDASRAPRGAEITAVLGLGAGVAGSAESGAHSSRRVYGEGACVCVCVCSLSAAKNELRC